MKAFILMTALVASLNVFATDEILSVEGLTKLSKTEAADVADALIIANGGLSVYGVCQFEAITKNNAVEVYVDQNSVEPLIIVLTDTEWMKINTDEEMIKLVSGTVGKWSWKKVNNGTIVKPVFKSVRMITSTQKCSK